MSAIQIHPESSTMATKGAEVTLHKVSYSIPQKKSKKVILDEITCRYPPGLNAILGPTGSGKSSLLDIIADRKDPKGQGGTIFIDGKPRPGNFRGSIGYVVQDDVVYGLLSVKENITFSANLRLRGNMSNKEREALVDQTLKDLGLTNCADTLVGTVYIRGVSGGERKRTNIGMELVIAPPVLFLDEPTTGLDSSTANALLLTLKNLGNNGHTIILSIHQPRYSIFKLFDQITLLSMGKLVYHGPADQCLPHFEKIGYQCETHDNPPDFFLDVINGDSTALQGGNDDSPGQSDKKQTVAITVEQDAIEMQKSAQGTIAADLEAKFRRSQIFIRQEQDLDQIETKNSSPGETTDVRSHASFPRQVKYISKRILVNTFRNPQTYITQICVVIVFALLTGGIYFRLNDTITQGIPNRAGAVFFIVMNQIFQNLSAVDIFIRERALFIHENSAGFYGCFAYFISKLICDILPMRLQPVVLFSVITYFMIGFQATAAKFFLFVLTLF